MQMIDLNAQYQSLKTSIDVRINDVLAHGRFIMGPEVAELEQGLAAFCGAKHAVTLSSGTDALLAALMSLGVSRGDEIITSPFSFIATAETIALLGASPVFVDIEPGTFNLDAALIEAAITSRTRVIIPVSLYGQCADMDTINAIANAAGVIVIEDAAQSFGASYKDRRSGALSTLACASFYPAKPLGCYGDGGACFTSDDEVAARLRRIRDHGQDGRYHHVELGLNARMDTLQAAILLAKLDVFPAELARRREIARDYNKCLKRACPAIEPPMIATYNESAYAQYTIRVNARDHVQKKLAEAGIPTAVHYPTPLHLQPAFAALGLKRGTQPHAEAAAERVLSLPMHPYLSAADIEEIVGCLAEAIKPE